MENSSHINDKVEQTLKSLEEMSSAEPNPYFYTRLQARMERELLQPRRIFGWQLKPVYALSAVAFMLIINVFTILGLQKMQVSNPERYNLYESEGF